MASSDQRKQANNKFQKRKKKSNQMREKKPKKQATNENKHTAKYKKIHSDICIPDSVGELGDGRCSNGHFA